MLFIDEPVTVGLSYTKAVPAYVNSAFSSRTSVLPNNTCPEYAQNQGTCGTYSLPQSNLVPNSTQNAAPFVWKTLQSWMKAFPQYSQKDFHIATESYGGRESSSPARAAVMLTKKKSQTMVPSSRDTFLTRTRRISKVPRKSILRVLL